MLNLRLRRKNLKVVALVTLAIVMAVLLLVVLVAMKIQRNKFENVVRKEHFWLNCILNS